MAMESILKIKQQRVAKMEAVIIEVEKVTSVALVVFPV